MKVNNRKIYVFMALKENIVNADNSLTRLVVDNIRKLYNFKISPWGAMAWCLGRGIASVMILNGLAWLRRRQPFCEMTVGAVGFWPILGAS